MPALTRRRGGSSARARPTATEVSCRSARRSPSCATSTNGSSATAARLAAGFRENTRKEYRRLIINYAHRYFPSKLKLTDVSTYTLARYLDWLADEEEQGKRLGDRTIANATMPLRAALATAKREGLIRHNPAQGIALPHREQIPEEEVKVFSREQLAAVIEMAPERHRLLLELLAATGLRIREAIALQRLHFQLEDGEPEVCVRRAIVRERIEAPKSKYGRREVRLPAPLAATLRALLATEPDQDSTALAFSNANGGALDPNNLRRRVLKPLVEEVNAPWAGFHTFRHTFASMHLRRGTNLLQLSRALGHHSPAFTLTRYTHLLPGDEAPALDLHSGSSLRHSKWTGPSASHIIRRDASTVENHS